MGGKGGQGKAVPSCALLKIRGMVMVGYGGINVAGFVFKVIAT